jgi:2Fe-2S ferredoxin
LNPIRKKINFVIVENNNNHAIETYVGEYPNLMFLLRDKLLLDGFGECGGVGRCATCIIEIKGIKGNSIKKERNEPTTLSKMGYEEDDIRLSCQLFITSDLEECKIEILDL